MGARGPRRTKHESRESNQDPEAARRTQEISFPGARDTRPPFRLDPEGEQKPSEDSQACSIQKIHFIKVFTVEITDYLRVRLQVGLS